MTSLVRDRYPGSAETCHWLGIALFLVAATPGGAAAQQFLSDPASLRPGDVVVIETPEPLATRLVKIDVSTGARTTLSDSSNPSQGPPILAPFSALAIDDASALYVADGSALYHVDPSTGLRTIFSDFADVSQGPVMVGGRVLDLAIEMSGDFLVLSADLDALRERLVRVNRSTGARAIVSDFSDPRQGPVAFVRGIAVEESGQIVAGGSRDGNTFVVIRVDSSNGERTLLSDLGGFSGGLQDLMVDFSGSILVVFGIFRSADFEGGELDRLEPATGTRTIVFGPAPGSPQSGFCGFNSTPVQAVLAETGDLFLITARIQGGFPQTLARLSTSGECRALTSGFMSDVAVVPTPLVNGMVSVSVASTIIDASIEDPFAPEGVFQITATFTNETATPIRNPFFRVVDLSGGNMLVSGDRHPDRIRLGGRGTRQTPDVGLDGVLSPAGSAAVNFRIGLQTRQPFTFFVNVFGEPDIATEAR